MENDKKPEIPDVDYLIKQAEELFSKISTNEMFEFSDFYELKNNEYCRTKPAKEERSGLYIFYKAGKPVYVGISREVIERIRQHMCRKSHNQASLAYLIVKTNSGSEGRRKDLQNKEEIKKIQREMREEWEIAIIDVDNPYVRYFSEIYFAAKLKTRWNDFETH